VFTRYGQFWRFDAAYTGILRAERTYIDNLFILFYLLRLCEIELNPEELFRYVEAIKTAAEHAVGRPIVTDCCMPNGRFHSACDRCDVKTGALHAVKHSRRTS
jgi:hypothetical protein